MRLLWKTSNLVSRQSMKKEHYVPQWQDPEKKKRKTLFGSHYKNSSSSICTLRRFRYSCVSLRNLQDLSQELSERPHSIDQFMRWEGWLIFASYECMRAHFLAMLPNKNNKNDITMVSPVITFYTSWRPIYYDKSLGSSYQTNFMRLVKFLIALVIFVIWGRTLQL